ncbi:MAG: hypothetical protein BWY85_01249 [Firmicutes bacterium ADurb.Bin506]|nr:MAG: hypothetical protein BWY85_01249 [Firmicutes bacterium ADurb.Bin506]
MASHTPMEALVAGTNDPACAISVRSPTVASTVDLPAMFGPVIMSNLPASWSQSISLATYLPGPSICSSTGWRAPLITVARAVPISGRT